MIIKVKQCALNQNSWRLHDNVHELAYATVNKASIPYIDGVPHNEQTGIQFEGDDGVVRETHFLSALPEVCECITFIDFNGKPHEIYTDAETYLLNDNGRTIERIQ